MKNLLSIFLILWFFTIPFYDTIGDKMDFIYQIRSLAMLAFIISIFLSIAFKKVTLNYAIHLFFIVSSLLIWYIVGCYNGVGASAKSELIAFLMMIFSVYSVFLANESNLLNNNMIEKWLFIFMKFWTLIYTSIFLLVVLGIVQYSTMVSFLYEFGGMTVDVGFAGIVPRIGNAVNSLALILYSFYLKRYRGGSWMIFFLILAFVFLDYSRVHIAYFIVLLIMFLKYKFTKIRFKSVAVYISVIICFVMFVGKVIEVNNVTTNDLVSATFARFDHTDIVREQQAIYLMQYFDESSFMGYGLGAYVPEYTRNTSPWVYEMEYHAFLMQLGIVGFIFIIGGIIFLVYRITYFRIKCDCRWIAALGLLLWILEASIQGAIFYNVGRAECIAIYLLSQQTHLFESKSI